MFVLTLAINFIFGFIRQQLLQLGQPLQPVLRLELQQPLQLVLQQLVLQQELQQQPSAGASAAGASAGAAAASSAVPLRLVPPRLVPPRLVPPRLVPPRLVPRRSCSSLFSRSFRGRCLSRGSGCLSWSFSGSSNSSLYLVCCYLSLNCDFIEFCLKNLDKSPGATNEWSR